MYVDVAGLQALGRDLHRASRDEYGHFRKSYKAAAEIVAVEARARASFSTRIPRSIRTSGTMKGATVKAGGSRAPHGPIYEKGGRHPVFGNRDRRWVPVSGRHYLNDALHAKMTEVERAVIEAALKETRGNRRRAADLLGIGERTLYRKIKEYRLPELEYLLD